MLCTQLFCICYTSKEQHEKYLCNPSSHNRKYGEYARETHAPKINYWKAHKPVHCIFRYALSVTQQYRQRAAWKASLQSIQPLRKIQRIYSWNARPIFIGVGSGGAMAPPLLAIYLRQAWALYYQYFRLFSTYMADPPKSLLTSI